MNIRTALAAICILIFIVGHSQNKTSRETNGSGEFKWPVTCINQIDLGENAEPHPGNTLAHFCWTPNSPKITVWGRGTENPSQYPAEWLPTFFSRSLFFDQFDPADGWLEWIFTGEQGGFTVRLDADSLMLIQRYYDSFGFNEFEGDSRIKASRHPEKTFIKTTTHFNGRVKSLRLECTYNLLITLYINGQKIMEQASLIDATRHQIRYSGIKGTVCGTVEEPAPEFAEVTVHEEKKFQTLMGFGGSVSVPAYRMLSEKGKKQWWNLVKEYNLLVQREYPMGTHLNYEMSNWESAADASTHYYGDNFPNGEVSDFPYIKKIRELGGMNIFEFWVLPPWCYGPGKDSIIYEQYTRAMLGYCRASKIKTGMAPEILGIENEITLTPEKWRQMTLHLRRALDEEGFASTRIHMHNAPNLAMGIRAVDAFKQNPDSWNKIDFAATNIYDYQSFIFTPDSYDSMMKVFHHASSEKPFISSEICVNIPPLQQNSYRLAFSYGQLYHKNMTLMNAISLLYCWTLLDVEQPSYSASRSLFKVDRRAGLLPSASSFQLRVFGAFSRHLPKGMKRTEAVSNNPDLLVTAYDNGKQQTIIMLNRGKSPLFVKINRKGKSFSGMERVGPFASNERENIPGVVNLRGGEILTLYN